MEYNQTVVFGTAIFLIIMYVASYCIKNHRFRNLVFWALYVIAIAPNLINFMGLINQYGMVNGILSIFFDSVYIFYIELIYLGALVVMVIRGWTLTRKKTRFASPISSSAIETVKSTIQNDLGPSVKPETVKVILKTVETSAKEQIPISNILQSHTECLGQTGGDSEKQTACFLSKMEDAIAQKRKEKGLQ